MGALRVPTSDLAEWAADLGATHALTLTAGCYPVRAFDPETSFRPYLKRLFVEIARKLRDHPQRYVARMRQGEFPAFFGFYEAATRAGAAYPHVHGVIALQKGEEEALRAILRTCWGTDKDADLTSPYLRHFPSLAVALRGVCRTKRDWRPTFELTPLRGDEWLGYSAKKYATTSIIWTHADILNLTT